MVNLTASGDTIKFEFENSPHYLYNGTIEVPKNSLSMVMDDSEMVTFKKSASNDIFVSIRYSELGKTKNEMLSWYKDNMVKEYVDEGEVDEQIEEATQNYFDGAEYDSNSKRINFKHGNTIKGYIDASDFVIDGMVDNVVISGGNLVITFNTDSGKQPISIPLTDIFNPNNYYDKTATDALLATKADTATTYSKTEVDAALSGKQDTLIAGENITISGNVISSEGGGKAIEGGRGISITTGETADTVSFNLPISADSNYNITIGALNLNDDKGKEWNVLFGSSNAVKTPANFDGKYNCLFGFSNTIGKAQGRYATQYNAVFGYNNYCYLNNSLICGNSNNTYNNSEFSSGQFNNSVSGSSTFGNSGNTLFSVGNGTSSSARHNAFEIRQNGDIYLTKDGQDVKLQDQLGGGNNVVTLTQSEYDSLVDKDPTAFYIISDAQGIDLSQYWTSAETTSAITSAVSGKVDTSTFNTYSGSVETALSGKQDTLSAGTGINITDNVISATGGGGGGKAVSAGTNISITTGETADTINCTLNASNGSGNYSFREGRSTFATKECSHAEGEQTMAGGAWSHAEGAFTMANADYSHTEGYQTQANNKYEHASGQYNNSVSASTTFGNSGNTLFSVGNGTAVNARHNAFEIRQNGDIYITSGSTDIKLQDHLGGGGASYSAGTGIDITNNVISVSADTSLDSGSTNAVANSAVATKINDSFVGTAASQGGMGGKHLYTLSFKRNNNTYLDANNAFHVMPINGIYPVKRGVQDLDWYDGLSLVETSAITTAITSSSTDAQVPSAKAVNDKLGGLSLVKLTQSEYSAMEQAGTLDNSTLYIVTDS